MATSVQFRPQNRDLGMVMREVDEDLAIFLGIRNGEKERNEHLILDESDEFNDSKGVEPKPDSVLALPASQPEIVSNAADDNLVNLETERSDDNWTHSQPNPSLLPSNLQNSAENQTEVSNGETVSLKSELVKTYQESASKSESSAMANRRPLSSCDRKPTPIGRSVLPAKTKPSRASTPTSRATFPSSKPMASQTRSSTPTRATSTRPSIPIVSKSAPRSATPTRKPSTPSTTSTLSSSSGRKTGSTTLKTPLPSCGTYPSVKSRPSKPLELLSLSHDAGQNLKVSMPRRPVSASRGRPSPSAAPLSSSTNGKPRQRSCSPGNVRAAIITTGTKMLSRSRGYSNDGDDVNPVLMGTKMVDRVVNMRKLAPPKQDECLSHDNHPKKSSSENSGFGRSLSKKSLDMAIRHMDIRQSISDKPRRVAKGVLSSSLTSSCDSSK